MRLAINDIALERDIADLAMDWPEVTELALRRIAARGPAAASALLVALGEDRLGGAGRGLVLRLLGQLALPETFAAVAAALRDPRYIVKSAALAAVASFESLEATAALGVMLEDSDPDIVREAADLLSKRADLNAVPALAPALEHPNGLCRSAVARALWAIGGPAARAALDARLTIERDPEVLRALNGGP